MSAGRTFPSFVNDAIMDCGNPENTYAQAQEDAHGKQDWTAIFDMLHIIQFTAA